MTFKPCFPILAILLFTGCASVNLRNEAVNDGAGSADAQSDLALTWDLNPDLSSEYFGYFNFNFANRSDKWHTLTGMRIVFPDEKQNKEVKVVLGRELSEWYEAQMKVIAVREFNQSVAAGLTAGVGAGIAGLAGNREAQAAGAALAVGAAGYLAVEEFGKARESLRLSRMIPRNHLLADSLVVPPGLFAQRWVLLNSANHAEMGFVDSLRIEYRLETGAVESKKVVIKRTNQMIGNRKWQAAYFEKAVRLKAEPLRP